MVRSGPLEPVLPLKELFHTFHSPVLRKEGPALQLAEGLKAGQATSKFPPTPP